MHRKRGAPPRGAAEPDRESVLEHRHVPSHPRGGKSRRNGAPAEATAMAGEPAAGGTTRAADLDLEEVAQLAARGLTLEEILVELDWEDELPASLKLRVEAAIKKGRARGSAALKQAQYRAALDGRVNAQAQMLSRLEGGAEPDDGEEESEFAVERVIVGGEETTD